MQYNYETFQYLLNTDYNTERKAQYQKRKNTRSERLISVTGFPLTLDSVV